MSLHSEAGPLTIDRLGPADLIETFGYLDRDPVVNVYLLALTARDGLAEPRDEFWAARREGELAGLLHIGGQSGAVLPVADDALAMRHLAQQVVERLGFLPRRFQVIGRLAAVAAIVERLQRESTPPRLHRRQLYMALERNDLAPFERLPELRPGEASDYDLLYASGAELRNEELEEDPRRTDPAAYGRRVEEECRDGHTYVWLDETGLRFRASISARTADAAQISGVYVPPDRRGRGYARRATSEICMRLFEHSQAACLFVNDFNAPALAVYRNVGFGFRADWASAFYCVQADG